MGMCSKSVLSLVVCTAMMCSVTAKDYDEKIKSFMRKRLVKHPLVVSLLKDVKPEVSLLTDLWAYSDSDESSEPDAEWGPVYVDGEPVRNITGNPSVYKPRMRSGTVEAFRSNQSHRVRQANELVAIISRLKYAVEQKKSYQLVEQNLLKLPAGMTLDEKLASLFNDACFELSVELDRLPVDAGPSRSEGVFHVQSNGPTSSDGTQQHLPMQTI